MRNILLVLLTMNSNEGAPLLLVSIVTDSKEGGNVISLCTL